MNSCNRALGGCFRLSLFPHLLAVRTDEDSLNKQDPHLFSQLLEQTKSHGRQLGVLGDAASKVIAAKREQAALGSAGKKVVSVTLLLLIFIDLFQRVRQQTHESLAAELAKPVPGSRSEAAVRQFLFSPKDCNRAPKKARQVPQMCLRCS